MQVQLLSWLLWLGRILFVTYFWSMGMSHLVHFPEHASFLARKGVPLPRAATLLTVVIWLVAGFSCCSTATDGSGRPCFLASYFPHRSSCTDFGTRPTPTCA